MINNKKISDMVYIAVFAVIIAICSWLSIPTAIPFTMQTFGVFFTVGMLGGKKGSVAVLLYMLLGAIGIPVFSEFRGGIGIMLGTTGGYIMGFLFSALVFWLFESILGRKVWVMILGMSVGLIVCYAFGTAWFMTLYAKETGSIGAATALNWCVTPYIIPDIVKIGLAILLCERLKNVINVR